MPKNDDGVMSWDQFWAYYKSSLCTEEQRKFTLASFSLEDALEVSTEDVQLEIINNAPEEIIKKHEKKLFPSVKSKLLKTSTNTNRYFDSEFEVEKMKQSVLDRMRK